jgi:hypothetical protein
MGVLNIDLDVKEIAPFCVIECYGTECAKSDIAPLSSMPCWEDQIFQWDIKKTDGDENAMISFSLLEKKRFSDPVLLGICTLPLSYLRHTMTGDTSTPPQLLGIRKNDMLVAALAVRITLRSPPIIRTTKDPLALITSYVEILTKTKWELLGAGVQVGEMAYMQY